MDGIGDLSLLNIEKRQLILVGSVDEEMLLKVLLAFDVLESLDHKKPIKVILSSYGGEAYTSLGIYDRIATSPCYVTIEVYGAIMSGGTLILQAARWRKLNRSTRFMIHYGSTDSGGNSEEKSTDVISRVSFEAKEDAALMDQIYLRRIKEKNKRFKHLELKKMLSTDTYLTARQAVDLGLADEVVFGEK